MSRFDDEDEGFEVGYGRPPRGSQFKPGKSGNPAGRPTKKKQAPVSPLHHSDSVAAKVRQDAARQHKIREGNTTTSLSTLDAVVRSIGASATKGKVFAQRLYVELVTEAEEVHQAELAENLKFWETYIQEKSAEMEAAKRRGQPAPEILPHPADIRIDYAAKQIRVEGPHDEESLERCNAAIEYRELWLMLAAYLGELHREKGSSDDQVSFALVVSSIVEQTLPMRLRLDLHQAAVRAHDYSTMSRRRLAREIERLVLKLTGVPKKISGAPRHPMLVELADLGLHRRDGAVVRMSRRAYAAHRAKRALAQAA